MKRELPKVFIDTNVLSSAFYGSATCEKLIKAHIDGKIEVLVSRQILTEIVRNFEKKIPHSISAFKKFMQVSPPLVVADPTTVSQNIKTNVDFNDQLIFQSAVNAKVKYFVTGNTKDFEVSNLQKIYKIAILTPSEAVQKFDL